MSNEILHWLALNYKHYNENKHIYNTIIQQRFNFVNIFFVICPLFAFGAKTQCGPTILDTLNLNIALKRAKGWLNDHVFLCS